ncbi:MAG: HlyD family efflux transporter periplasmic adaptor subunit [Dehalococcoidia bacterium]|nr:HlyD family efflux transporter periplasmic adaptor subunit [Dehalococcoidia bacterium]
MRLKTQQWLYFDMPGTVKEVLVARGDRVRTGQPLVKLDDTDLRTALSQAENTLRQQELALDLAENAARSARLDLGRATERLEEVLPTSSDVVYTWYPDIPAVRDNLSRAQARLAELISAVSAGRTGDAASQLEQIKALLSSAYNASLTSEFVPLSKQAPVSQTTSTLRQLRYEVEKARLAVEQAGLAVEQSRAAVEAARLNVERARRDLVRATLTAPFDGTIAEVPVRAGDRLGPATYTAMPILRIVDPSSIEMEGYLDELDRPRVSVGSEVTIAVDALPGVPVKGTLSYLSPLARVQSGVVSYAFTISLRPPYPAELADGMSATATLAVTTGSGTK